MIVHPHAMEHGGRVKYCWCMIFLRIFVALWTVLGYRTLDPTNEYGHWNGINLLLLIYYGMKCKIKKNDVNNELFP